MGTEADGERGPGHGFCAHSMAPLRPSDTIKNISRDTL